MATEVGFSVMDASEVKEMKGKLFVTFLNLKSSNNQPLQVKTLLEINFTTLTLRELKEIIIQDTNCPSKSIDEIDILYKAQVITARTTSTLEHLKMKPNSIVNVIKRIPSGPTESPATGHEKILSSPANVEGNLKKFTSDQLHQVSMALRTGFIHPSFPRTIKKLGDPEMLENIIVIAPQLATDSIGLAIIQSPSMIYYYTEMEPMKKLAEERPWVIDAFNFIAAAIHQDKSFAASSGPNLPRGLVVPGLLSQGEVEGEEDMDDEEFSGNSTPRSAASSTPRAASSQPNIFTRELVEQAIRNANLAAGLSQTSNVRPASVFPSMSNPLPPPTAQPASSQSTISSSAFQNALLSALQQQRPSDSSQSSGSTDFARAIMDAVNHLTPEARAAQLNVLRDRIQQISGATNQSQGQSRPEQSVSNQQAQAQHISEQNPQSTEFQDELIQMREIGITNERLALLALRVSDGDVGTASNLIFSGWNGEGAEDETHQE